MIRWLRKLFGLGASGDVYVVVDLQRPQDLLEVHATLQGAELAATEWANRISGLMIGDYAWMTPEYVRKRIVIRNCDVLDGDR